VLEVERGASGWHPHFHVLLLLEGRPPSDAVDGLVADLRRRWCDALAAEGGAVPAGCESVAVEGHVLRRPEAGIPAYLAKGHADLLGRLASDVKVGALGTRETVEEFQRATRGCKRVVVSQAAGYRGRLLSAFRRAWRAVQARSHGPGWVRCLALLFSVSTTLWSTVGDSGLPGP